MTTNMLHLQIAPACAQKRKYMHNQKLESTAVDSLTDRSVAWPDNANGFVVSQKELEEFIGNQTLYQAQTTAKRFVIIAEAARRIARGEQFDLNLRLIRLVAGEDQSADYQYVIKAMLRAIDCGEEGIKAVSLTALHVMDFGFECMTSYGNEFIYKEGLERMNQSAERLD